MEDPQAAILGPRPLSFPLASYDVDLMAGMARMVPVHDPSEVSGSLIAFLASEMNDEVK